jgi:hypothetical protein
MSSFPEPLTHLGLSIDFAELDLRKTGADYVDAVALAYTRALEKMEAPQRLRQIFATPGGLRTFAETYTTYRCDFVRMLFLVGARCGYCYPLYSSLAHNVHDEAGGEDATPHNILFENFLEECGGKSTDQLLREGTPPFALKWFQDWEDMANTWPVEDAFCVVSNYEILDQPDHLTVIPELKRANLAPRGLKFWEVHASTFHWHLHFPDLGPLSQSTRWRLAMRTGAEWVLTKHVGWWADCLRHVEACLAGKQELVPLPPDLLRRMSPIALSELPKYTKPA